MILPALHLDCTSVRSKEYDLYFKGKCKLVADFAYCAVSFCVAYFPAAPPLAISITNWLMRCAFLSLQVDGESAPSQYVIDIEGGSHGQLGAGHLADHPTAVTALHGAVKVGDPLGPLLVLERVEVRSFSSLHIFAAVHVKQ